MKSEIIRVRVEPELKELIAKAAKKENRTISNYMLNALLNQIERDKINMTSNSSF